MLPANKLLSSALIGAESPDFRLGHCTKYRLPMSSMSTPAPLDPAQFSLCRHGHPVQNGEIFLELQGACNKACLLLLPPCTLTLMLSTMAPLIYLLKYFNKTASAHSGYRRYLYHQGNEKTTGGTVEAAAKPWLIPISNLPLPPYHLILQ